MRRLLTIIAILFVNIIAVAQAPSKMSYQAVIRSNNALVVSTQIGMRVSIIKDSATGIIVYQETYNPQPTTNANGLVSVEIGGGNPSIGLFDNIDWSVSTYFVKIETDVTGGTNYTNIGVSQLLSVPYALNAKNASKTSDTTIWSTNGNSHLRDSSFIGTCDTFDLKFKVNNNNAGFISFRNNNTALGYNSLKSPKSGYDNISIGVNNLNNDSSGYGNIGIGNNTLNSLKTGFGNIAVGHNSQSRSSGAVVNISIGGNTLRDNIYGNGNIAIGTNALMFFDFPVWLAAYNTAIGEGSIGRATTGYRNTGIGAYSFHYLTSGQENIAIGIDAGRDLKTGNYNIFLGNGTNVVDSSISNSVVIGANAIAGNSNVILLGDTTNTALNVGIGTANPQRKLHIKSVMRLEPINSAPLSPSKGDMYFDGIINKLRVYDGTTWQSCW